MINDDRFAAIGSSGEWGLKAWKHIETRTITKLMEEFLEARNESATVEEIFQYVRSRRQAKRTSVSMSLTTSNLFEKTDRTKWGLSVWAETRNAETWNVEQVAKFISGLFRNNRAKELDYSIVKRELMESASVTARQAAGLINRNPVSTPRKGEKYGDRILVLRPDWKSQLGARRVVRKKATLFEQTGEIVRGILEKEPTKEMTLSDLIAVLSQRFGSPKHTFYQYIKKLDFVEYLEVPNSNVKVCRLKGTGSTLAIPGVSEISNVQVKKAIERALEKINNEDVDIGLFLLGKEFELSVKKYLMAADAKGKITLITNLGKDPQRWKLAHMVDCLKTNQVIQDAGALQYLREQRNDRAHDATPSPEERRQMLETASHFATMYIGYIKLLDNLWSALDK